MAIMEQQVSQIEGGFDKSMEASGRDMMLDIFQKNQYQFPVKSTIRELVSNCLDSIRERDVAVEILTGTSMVTDYYEEKEGDIYNDSRFNPDYYNPDYLSTDPKVYITYKEGKNMERDSIEIRDNGVGLGGRRLEKYFSLFFSSKRLSRAALGFWGLGNKSPLSLNMGYYTVESRYNGQKYKFNVYSGKIESIIPKIDLESGKVNQVHTLLQDDGKEYEYYSVDTDEKNGLTIYIEAKKSHKEQYRDAVQSQLLYFDNIDFKIEHQDRTENVDYKADIIYEDDYIILSDSDYYSKPHLLLNKVNYGYVSWDELELEDKVGNIGIKVQPSEVSINPSRESLVWNDTTKEIIQKRFSQVVDIATKLVQEELKEKDFIKWLRTCYGISSRYGTDRSNGSVVERLSCLIDMSKVQPLYPGTDIKFNYELFEFLTVQQTEIVPTKKANKSGTKVQRTDIKSMYATSHLPILLSSENASNRKDKYLLSLYPQGFIRIKPPVWLTDKAEGMTKESLLDAICEGKSESDAATIRARFDSNKADKIWELLLKSSETLLYKDIEVPDSFKGSNDEEDLVEEELTVEEAQGARLSAEARRKLEGKVVLMTPRMRSVFPNSKGLGYYEWNKLEIPVKEIDNWKEEEIYYGNDVDSDTLQLVTFLTRNSVSEDPLVRRKHDIHQSSSNYARYSCTHFFDNPEIKIIKVSMQTTKYYRDFFHINKFFYRVNNNTLTMSNILIKWNTARQIKQELHKLNFLWNYPFSREKQEKFKDLVIYVKENYREMAGFEDKNIAPEAISNLTGHLDKVQQFQMFVQENKNPEDIAKLALEMWSTDTIQDACAIDMKVWQAFKELVDWAEPIAILLNEMPILTGIACTGAVQTTNQFQSRLNCHIPENLEHTLHGYIKSKGVTS